MSMTQFTRLPDNNRKHNQLRADQQRYDPSATHNVVCANTANTGLLSSRRLLLIHTKRASRVRADKKSSRGFLLLQQRATYLSSHVGRGINK